MSRPSSTDLIFRGRDSLLRTIEQTDDAELRDMMTWHHRWEVSARLGRKQGGLLSDVTPELALRIFTNAASPDDRQEYKRRIGAFRKQCGASNKGLYADTSYSREIISGVNAVRKRSESGRGRILIIEGDGGSGKTTTLTALHQMDQTGRLHLLRGSCAGGFKSFIDQLGELTGEAVRVSYGRQLARLRYSWRAGDGLIIDEAHQLVDPTARVQRKVEFLRELVDITNMFLVLCSTDDQFRDLLQEACYKNRQISHRTLRTVNLPRRSPQFDADATAVFKFMCPHLDINAGLLAAFEELHDCRDGGFGMIGNVLDAAIADAEERDRTVTIKDIALEISNRREGLKIAPRK